MASSPEINRFNEQWRASPQYRQILTQVGANPDGPLHLSNDQREAVKRLMEQAGFQIPKGEIDPAGNVNEDEGFSKHAKWIIPAAIGAATLGVGALGAGPAAGLFGGLGGGSAAGGGAAAGGALASSSIPTSLAMGAVPGIGAAAGGAGAAGGLGLLGTIGKYSGAIGDVGSVLSGAAQGSAAQRNAESSGLLSEANIHRAQAADQYQAGLSSANFDREGQDRAKKQQILMTLLGNTKDQSLTPGNPAIAGRMPTVSGGARPSNLTNNREALMALLQQPQMQAPQYQAPPQFKLPRAGAMENILGGIGTGANIAGALGRYF